MISPNFWELGQNLVFLAGTVQPNYVDITFMSIDISADTQFLKSLRSPSFCQREEVVTEVFIYLNHICRRGTVLLIAVNLTLNRRL